MNGRLDGKVGVVTGREWIEDPKGWQSYDARR
jgi:hypothetical protein